MEENSPLFSVEFERHALGAMMLSPIAADEIEGVLSASHFYVLTHGLLFDAICDAKSVGDSIEYQDVIESLRLRKFMGGRSALEAVGGENVILQCAEFCPSPTNGLFYAQRILDCWVRRELSEIGKAAEDGACDLDAIRERMERAQAVKTRATPPRSGHISEFRREGRPKGVPTGFDFIDKPTTTRGLPNGQLSVVMAETGGGKTAWEIQVAINAARKGYRVCFATFADLDGYDILDRITKNLCGFALEPMPGTVDHERYCEAMREVSKLPIDVFDVTDLFTGREVETFAAWFKQRLAKIRYDLLIVDYAQELTTKDRRARTTFDVAETCAHVLRWLAKNTGVPILAGSQMTEGNAKSGTKDITKGSRVWQERAALVIKLSVLTDEDRQARKDVNDTLKAVKGLTEAHLQKNRFGQKNLKAWWRWSTDYASFTELGS